MTDTVQRTIQSSRDAYVADIVVVDDGSIDGSWRAIDTFHSIKTHRFKKPVGVCGARNYAIQLAGYVHIIPLDADDELLPDGVETLLKAHKDNTFVYGGWYEGDTYISPPPPEMLTRKNVAHATWLFHRDDWQRVGGYDPDFNIGGEDYAFMVALVNAGVQPIRIDVPIYRKHIREGSRTAAARSRYPFIQQLLREKYPAFFA
jgi:glycosyltransferase involved in cell wall biosynthesis